MTTNPPLFKASILFMPFFIIFHLLHAQPEAIKISVNEPVRGNFSEGMAGIVGTTDDGFYLYRIKNKGIQIETFSNTGSKGKLALDYYDNQMNLQKFINISDVTQALDGKPKGKTYEFFVQDAAKTLWLYYSELQGIENILYRKKLDHQSFSFLTAEIVSRQAIPHKKLDKRSTYKFIWSDDKQKCAIYSFTGHKKEERAQFYAEVFDKNLNSLWKLNVEIPYYQGDGFRLNPYDAEDVLENNLYQSIILSNDGVINSLLRLYKKDKSKGVYKYLLLSVSESEELNYKIINISPDKYIIDLLMTHDFEGNVRLGGTYFDDDDHGGISGIMFQLYDPINLDLISDNILPFTKELKLDYLISSENTAAKSKGSLKEDEKIATKLARGKDVNPSQRNKLIDLFYHDNGSITLISEYTSIEKKTSTTVRGDGTTRSRTSYDYIAGDLQFINLSNHGDINWIKSYYKNQHCWAAQFNSIAAMHFNDEIYFVYNDYAEKTLSIGYTDAKGNFQTRVEPQFFKGKGIFKFYFIPATTTQLNEYTYIGIARETNKFRFLKFEFR